jgi:hypothetical protein
MQLRQTRQPPGSAGDFDVTRFCEGRTLGTGILEGPFGRLKKRFTCEILGAWEGERFVMRETFTHHDGTIDKRTWRIVRHEDGRIEGESEDLVGRMTGRHERQTLRSAYVLKVKVKGRAIPIRFDDRLHAMPDGRVLNRATMYLFGIRVGELTFVLERA